MSTPSIPDLMRLARQAQEELNRLLDVNHLARRLEILEDEAWSPQAPSDEFRPWCVTHDQRLAICEFKAAGSNVAPPGGYGCVVGVEQDPGSPVNDPTGSTASATGNPKRSDLRTVRRELEAVLRAVGHIDVLTAQPERIDGAKLAMASRKVAGGNAKAPEGCEPCGAVGAWTPPHTKNPTDVDGRLSRKQWLCRFHYGFVNTYGELPNEDEEARHQSGLRVTRVVRQTDRLRRGLVEGKLT